MVDLVTTVSKIGVIYVFLIQLYLLTGRVPNPRKHVLNKRLVARDSGYKLRNQAVKWEV